MIINKLTMVAKRDSEEQNQEIAELCKGGREEVNKLQ